MLPNATIEKGRSIDKAIKPQTLENSRAVIVLDVSFWIFCKKNKRIMSSESGKGITMSKNNISNSQ